MDFDALIQFLLRWIHVVASILWMGMLYYLNFVNSNFEPTLDGDTKKKVVPQLRPRVLFIFRWGAMVTFIVGLLLFVQIYVMGHMMDLSNARFQWITLGLLLGTIMWFNVWFIIWPAQKQIIPAVRDGKAGAEDIQALIKKATKFSKINVYLSFPMLAGMLGANHFVTWPLAGPGAVIAAATLGVPWWLYKSAPKIQAMVEAPKA